MISIEKKNYINKNLSKGIDFDDFFERLLMRSGPKYLLIIFLFAERFNHS